MIQNVIFGILCLKILFRAYNVFIFVQTFQWTSSEFFLISDFLAESLKANKNWQKRSHILQYSFTHKISLVFRTSTHLTLKIISTRNTAKKLSDFINFSAYFCLLSEEIFALHHFLTPRTAFLKHFESKCLNISIYLIKKTVFPLRPLSLRPCCKNLKGFFCFFNNE